MRRTLAGLLVMIAAAGCGGGAESTTVAADGATTPAAPTTGAPAAPTTQAATATEPPLSTVAEASGGADCIVGDWELDSEAFIEAISEEMADEMEGVESFEFVSGSFVVKLTEDGTYTSDRDDWTFQFRTAEGAIRVTISGFDIGEYTVEDRSIVVSDVNQASVTKFQAEVDGEFVDVPFGGFASSETDVFVGTAAFTCSGDELQVMTEEGVTATFTRVE